MKYIAICARGLEDITIIEIKELLNVNSKKILPGRIQFETKDINLFIDKTQSAIKVYEFKQKCKSLEEIKTFKIKNPFKVTCSRKGDHEYTSQYVEQEIGEKFYNEKNKVDLKDPKTIVFIDIIEKDIVVGIDLTPTLLSKREYRIRQHNQSINACIAYALVRLSDYDKNKTLLDPFGKDGVVAIEAALFKEGKIYTFEDLFHHVRNIEINSKLAGARKKINVSRTEVEWLDTKFKEREVDCVATIIPYPSKQVKENKVKKIYKELLHHLAYIMKKGSKMVFLAPRIELFKEINEKFKVLDERTVSTSNLEYKIIILQK